VGESYDDVTAEGAVTIAEPAKETKEVALGRSEDDFEAAQGETAED
jgi:hypothetical protein